MKPTRRCTERGSGRFVRCMVRTCSSNTLRSDGCELAGNSWPHTEQDFEAALVTRCGGRGCMNINIGCPIAWLVAALNQIAGTRHPSCDEGENLMSDRERKKIVGVGRINEHVVMVEYADITTAIYTADQLAPLTPQEIASGEEVEEDGE
jgi:hypothetical protein